jgi:uncharacterized protein (UPF0276 family)
MNTKPSFLGFGLGLRPNYYEELLNQKPPVDWFEIITENYLTDGGKPLYYLEQFRQNYPLVMHGVSLSIGSSTPLDWTYLKQVKNLALQIEPAWISDHLCWTGVDNVNLHDLLPLPYTEEAIQHVVSRIQTVQEFLQRRLVIENVSSYLTYTQSEMQEWEFLNEILKRADCYLLLDINNVYVSAINHHFNPYEYIHALAPERIIQIHLAGHTAYADHIIDTHDNPIVPPVWQLYENTIQRIGPISTLIERDDNMPPLGELLKELQQARFLTQKTNNVYVV